MTEKDYLTLDITFYMKDDTYDIKSDMNEEGQINLLEWFLRDQVGAGEDTRKAIDRETYHITLSWNPDHDKVNCSYNTGNKGLREGILMTVLRRMERDLKKNKLARAS